MLDRNLQGIKIGPRQPKTTIKAYADDVTILITTPDEIPVIRDALLCYQSASGALINLTKSKAMAVGGWDKNTDIVGIAYHESIKILGIQFHSQTDVTANNNWTQVTRSIRTQASEAYNRELSMSQRISYTHTYLMSKAWYVAQVLSLPKIHERQLKTSMNWYVWHGVIFKVPLTTLQRPKREGGWGIVKVAAKSRALFLHRIREQGQKHVR
jgi:hypothetical protein